MITALITAVVSVLGLLGVLGLVSKDNTEIKKMTIEEEKQFETPEFRAKYE